MPALGGGLAMGHAKMKVGILGTGNIGSDLLVKVLRSPRLACGIFAGRSMQSPGIIRAAKLGVPVTDASIYYMMEHPECCELVFDATSAENHKSSAPILKRLGKYAIDLTPAHVGKFCIPILNAQEGLQADNINMVTCGGQATVPIAHALMFHFGHGAWGRGICASPEHGVCSAQREKTAVYPRARDRGSLGAAGIGHRMRWNCVSRGVRQKGRGKNNRMHLLCAGRKAGV